MAQINKPSEYFNTKLFTGNGSTNAITGVGFQPDLVWSKSRNQTTHHLIYDSVRGVHKFIQSSTPNAEQTNANTLISFDSDGMTFGSADNGNNVSSNGVAWNWKANGAGVSNTDGSITSTVSTSTTSGFSIVTYTGTGANATVGHGLGSVPKMVIVKRLSNISSWSVYHSALGNSNQLYLNLDWASTSSGAWNNTSPTSSVFSLSSDNGVNASGDNFIAYCFAEKKGFSKFGSHVGNGSTNGTFIYTGFKPAFFLLKPSSGTGQWFIWDSTRSPINQVQKYLSPEANFAEGDSSGAAVDFVSNGVKIRNSDGGINQNGITYITMAFAEHPLVSSTGTPVTAR